MSFRAVADDEAVLEDRIGYRFNDSRLLERALTHRSWCAEHKGSLSNERLEFLGDAVLGLVVARRLHDQLADRSEGHLAKARASLVSAATLAEVAASIGVGDFLRLGRSEEATGGRAKSALLCDALEAVMGALYLDGGIHAAEQAVERLLGDRFEDAARAPGRDDFKSRLQERTATLGLAAPCYEVTSSGPAHQKHFAAIVQAGTCRGHGEGATKKEAEQRAARVALTSLASPPRSGESS